MNKEQEITKIQQDAASFMKVIKNSKTTGDLLLGLSKKFLGDEDPKTKFLEFVMTNKTRLKEAIEELGIDVKDGSNYFERLEKAYIEKITEK